jgi:CMP/dCMP kinase
VSSKSGLIIAIDGPAGSGKSTTARLVAEKLGLMHLDTGAMYRAVALKMLKHGVELTDRDALQKLLDSTIVTQKETEEGQRILLDGADATEAIRTPEISLWVGPVSEHPVVRDHLVQWQRSIGKEGGVVLEGRDIGTVVFPEADLKIFLVADVHVRALRRQREMAARGIEQHIDDVEEALTTRDQRDSTREHSPLKKADDAVEIDTTHVTIGDQVAEIVKLAQKIKKPLR